MTYTTLISASLLNQNLNNPNWIIIDCRFSLANYDAGHYAYRHGHIPHACYANLNKDLSAQPTELTGRHPLPDFNLLTKKLGDWGINHQTQVVVYDDAGGAFAGRLWWLLRCLGHDKVAVLNGGIQHWQKLGYALTTSLPCTQPSTFRAYLNCSNWLTARQVENHLAKKDICLIDARSPERYRGEQEPIDPIAGHIPLALNRPLTLNLDKQGLFLSPETLAQQFKALIATTSATQVVHYCGSGVTACHNLLAMEYAGLKGSKIYAGSWSEWISNKNRTIITEQNIT
ncbi:MAG: sulfurtransferase [Methylococcales bacterium]|nr:MAG: sulfurtransferase [Methylococcales bacterium]